MPGHSGLFAPRSQSRFPSHGKPSVQICMSAQTISNITMGMRGGGGGKTTKSHWLSVCGDTQFPAARVYVFALEPRYCVAAKEISFFV